MPCFSGTALITFGCLKHKREREFLFEQTYLNVEH